MKAFKLSFIVLLASFIVFSSSCKKDDPVEIPVLKLPTVTTIPVHGIKNFVAFSGGEVVSDGGETVTARGVCWSTEIDPTVENDKTVDGAGAGNFISELVNLEQNTLYYTRAYATTKNGTGYGSTMSFTTSAGFYFTPTSAAAGSTVTVSFFGGDNVTFTQGSNCPDLTAMATLTQGTSTIIMPKSINYIDNKHFEATYTFSAKDNVGAYNVIVGDKDCSRWEYQGFNITQ
jgi:hypothetical protein